MTRNKEKIFECDKGNHEVKGQMINWNKSFKLVFFLKKKLRQYFRAICSSQQNRGEGTEISYFPFALKHA